MFGNRDLFAPREVLASERVRIGHDRPGRALGDDAAAMLAGGGAHVDDPIGLADRLVVMLDDQHSIPQVAQTL